MTADLFNLPPPPGFHGIDPNLPVTMYQRHLPHWRQKGATYFVTFRLADALPQAKLHELKQLRLEWERTHPPPRSHKDWEKLAYTVTRRAEAWMDEGYGECFLAVPEHAEIMSAAFLHFQNERCMTYAYVVMPNHCHAVVQPLGDFELEDLLASWKGYTCRMINQRLQRQGGMWQDESFDRMIRDGEHLFRAVQYAGSNPQKAGLSRDRWCRWIHPAWEAAGWGFRDVAG